MLWTPPRKLIARPRGPFAFPGANPGFDPSHVASVGCLLSAMPRDAGNYINLLTGAPGVVGGAANAPSSSIHVMLGNANYTPNNGNVSFAYPATNWTAQTMAVIYAPDAATGANIRNLLSTSATGSSGFLLALSNSPAWSYNIGVTFSNIPSVNMPDPIAGNPYFYAVSFIASTIVSAVLTDLATGKNYSFSTTTSVPVSSAGDTSIYLGNRGLNTRQSIGKIAAAMHSNQFMSLAQLQLWARNPWAFWYPT